MTPVFTGRVVANLRKSRIRNSDDVDIFVFERPNVVTATGLATKDECATHRTLAYTNLVFPPNRFYDTQEACLSENSMITSAILCNCVVN